MSKALLTAIFGVGMAASTLSPLPSVVHSGTVRNCGPDGRYGVTSLPIAAFDPGKAHTLDTVLKWMDTADLNEADSVTRDRYSASYFLLLAYVKDSSALARAASDAMGGFTLTIPSTDSVIVLAARESDDENEPYFFHYERLGGRANGSVMLDMCG